MKAAQGEVRAGPCYRLSRTHTRDTLRAKISSLFISPDSTRTSAARVERLSSDLERALLLSLRFRELERRNMLESRLRRHSATQYQEAANRRPPAQPRIAAPRCPGCRDLQFV